MRARSILRPLAFLLLVAPLAFAPRQATATLSPWPHDPTNYTPIAPSPSDQSLAQMLPDGAGGAYFLFTDKRSGTEDVYLQRVTALGTVAPGWVTSGVPVALFSSRKLEPQMVSDGTGGVIVAWADYRSGNGDIYGQRVLGNSNIAGGWPLAGLQIDGNANTDRRPMLCTDGAGGAFIAWENSFSVTDTDVFGARVTAGGALTFSTSLDFALTDARQIGIAPDNAGGFCVAYQDSSSLYSGRSQIFGEHANSAGTVLVGPMIINLGTAYSHKNPQVVADGSGGFWAVWLVNDVHSSFDLEGEHYGSNLQAAPGTSLGGGSNLTSQGLWSPDYRVAPDGTGAFLYSCTVVINFNEASLLGHAPPFTYGTYGWPFNVGSGSLPSITSDGSGGAIGAFFGNTLLARRITQNGGSVPHWGTNNVTVTAQTNVNNGAPWSVPDPNHGAILGWTQSAFPNPNQVYAQRIDRFGVLGNAEPTIASVADAPADQGGHVRLVWNASYLDADPLYDIGSYYIWRSTPAASANAAVRLGAKWIEQGESLPSSPTPGRLFRHAVSSAYAWEYVATQNANASPQYSYLAPTPYDSTGSGNRRTVFMVEARWNGVTAFWDSAPDSGYSVDNIAPSAPAQFTGQYMSGTSHLHWLRNGETDLAGYHLYRGISSSFTPGPSNQVASPPDTGYTDAAGAAYYYKLSAIDIHGNESLYATLLPDGIAGVPVGAPAPKLALAVVSANPMSHEAILRFDLTRSGTARLAIYNAAGQQVRVVAKEEFAGGEWIRRWDGVEANGVNAPSGLYFVRLEAEGKALVRKLVLER